MNFVFIMIHIHEFYFVLEVSRHKLTTSFDIPCPRPNYEGDFFCAVVNYHIYHQMLQYPKAVVDLQPANKQWTHASDMKIYPSILDIRNWSLPWHG